jgi:hypothetical protein
LDSHHGDVIKELVMSAKGVPIVEITRHDFRVVEGIRFPFAVDYRSPNGQLLASDRFERIEVKRTPGWYQRHQLMTYRSGGGLLPPKAEVTGSNPVGRAKGQIFLAIVAKYCRFRA